MMQQIIGTPKSDRYSIITDTDWSEYQKTKPPNCLVSFRNNIITIMSPGRNHEIIGDLIRAVIWGYCRQTGLLIYTFNQTRLIESGKEGKEPDVAYSFSKDKDKPDLAVEINFTSRSIDDLTKYQYLKIPEVWLWEKDQIKFFVFRPDGYLELTRSEFLPELQSIFVTDIVNHNKDKSPLEVEKLMEKFA